MDSYIYSTVFPAGTNAKFKAAVLLLSAAADMQCNYVFNPAWEGCFLKAQLKHDSQNLGPTNP